jgi:hypothetical protein
MPKKSEQFWQIRSLLFTVLENYRTPSACKYIFNFGAKGLLEALLILGWYMATSTGYSNICVVTIVLNERYLGFHVKSLILSGF